MARGHAGCRGQESGHAPDRGRAAVWPCHRSRAGSAAPRNAPCANQANVAEPCALRSDDTDATWSGATDIPDLVVPARHNGSPAVWATEMGDAIRCSSPETLPINGDGWTVPLRPGVGFAPIQSLSTRPGPYWISARSYTSVAPVS